MNIYHVADFLFGLFLIVVVVIAMLSVVGLFISIVIDLFRARYPKKVKK